MFAVEDRQHDADSGNQDALETPNVAQKIGECVPSPFDDGQVRVKLNCGATDDVCLVTVIGLSQIKLEDAGIL